MSWDSLVADTPDKEQVAKAYEILALAMHLEENKATTTHDVARWLTDIVAPAIRTEL